MNLKQIENKWKSEFLKSDLVKDENYQPLYAKNLFFGCDQSNDILLKIGFEKFHDNFNYNEIDSNLNILLQYLNYIGISISRKSIDNYINKGKGSYQMILKKAFYIFKYLASDNNYLDINDPFHDNMGDLYFFLRIEEGDSNKPTQLTFFDELELPDFYNKYIELPIGYEIDDQVKKLFHLIETTNNSVFITGKAGTGKSTFIHYLTKKSSKQILLVAFTGIAAINIGGQTIHSFFRFPIKPLLPNDPDITIFKEEQDKFKIIQKTDILIIDEVSMLRSDILEGLDFSLRMNGGHKNKLFGGKQLILVGDIFQLPPIVNHDGLIEKELFQLVYESEYFFDSISYIKMNPIIFEFKKIHRQSNDYFINLLNSVRDCTITDFQLNELNKRYNPLFISRPEDFVITLTTSNYLAKNENIQKLLNLPYRSFYFQATIIGDFKEDKYPTDFILELKRNSQVIFIKNDPLSNGRRWVNGTIAKVEYVDDEKLEIKLQNGSIHILNKEIWEHRQYQWDKEKGRITSKIVGTFEQYPIKLAWAITIHKSQGLTFDNVIIDLGSGAFVNGQLYTALSRCRTLEGISLKKRIQRSDIIIDKRIINFYEKKIKNS